MSIAAQLLSIPYFPNSINWFMRLRNMDQPIWLDSGQPQSQYGRFDILSANPRIKLSTAGEYTKIIRNENSTISTENPFELLQQYLPQQQQTLPEVPFCGGALGYFGYDLCHRLERLPQTSRKDISLPDMSIGIYCWAIVQDHEKKMAWLVTNQALGSETQFSPIRLICQQTASNALTAEDDSTRITQPTGSPFHIGHFEKQLHKQNYFQALAKIHEYITAGDCYQVNFTQRFSANYEGDTLSAYLSLRDALPSPFSAYMEVESGAILSLSPERFIKVKGRQVETKPIKGTIARGKTTTEDLHNAKTLTQSAKDRAENIMIVDLLRNDLSKSCDHVSVPELCQLQSFANVHHLVSTVTASLKPEMNALKLLSGSFPGGSITGAPKIRAMEIIDELEPVHRSVYCGSLGYISACGNMDTNIAIRTLVCEEDKIHCWGGGGIVADSVIENEYQESIFKVSLLMETLEKYFGNKLKNS